MSNHMVRRLPFQLSFRTSGATSGYDDVYNVYDYGIGGIPFLNAINNDRPLIRRSSELRKQQIDQSAEPGEQSLTGWWLRSQSSFHGGTGLRYLEPSLDDSAPFRFADAEGVDIWTPGQLTLLKDSATAHTAPDLANPVLIVGAVVGGEDVIVWGNGTNAGMVASDGTNYNFTHGTAPATAFQDIASDGSVVYFINQEGVFEATLPGSPGAVATSKLWTLTATDVCLGWVKGRLMAGVDEALYELVPPVGAAPYALPGTAVYTALASGWAWTSITAGPDAIYASGYAGNRGGILQVTIDTQGALPTLTGATEVAQLPTGEWPLKARVYLGSFMAIGTSGGVRIAEIGDGGNLEYGPLIETDAPVYDLVGRDKFVYATCTAGFSDGNSGLIRIDLSLRHSSGMYAWGKDLKASASGTARTVALLGASGRIAMGLDGTGVIWEHATNLVSQGYIESARIRYNTLWPKLFKRLSLRGTITGTVSIATINDSGTETTIVNVSSATDLAEDISINTPDSPQEFLTLKFYVNRDTATTGPTLRGYQLKSLPGGPRPRDLIIPVLCFDREKDRHGVDCGYPGFGLERLEDIEELTSSGEVVLFEDLNMGRSVLVTIEDYEFRQISPHGHNDEHWGGILTLSLRTVTS